VLAYVSHGLREVEVDRADAAQVAALARLLDVEHTVLQVRVLRGGGGVESDARDVRHAALEAEADRRGVRFVLHGHHAEDQAETLLLRLARGTGVEGLGGMAAVAGRRLRPLLDVRRDDLHRIADELLAQRVAAVGGTAPGSARHDPMNDAPDIARVRLRREVLPALARVGPDPVGALVRLAALARDETALLDRLVDDLRATVPVVTFGAVVLVPSGPLRDLPVALARRVLRRALPGGTDAATVERLLAASDGWRATLPGPLDASVGRGWHVIAPVAPSASPRVPASPEESVLLDTSRPGPFVHAASGVRLELSDAGDGAVTIAAELPGGVPPGVDPSRLTVGLRSDGMLRIRGRRDGDRLRTPGGTRSLGDVLREVGVPLALRDLLPVITDADDRPLWVPGVVADETALVRPLRRPDPSG
jgi:tRNA(Ile)-lysidine synthase